jgi:hypothetical protein
MKMLVFLGLSVLLVAFTVAFWLIKGKPLDWDGFFPRGTGEGPAVMTQPGNPLKKQSLAP